MNAIRAIFDSNRPHFEGEGRLAWAWPIFELVETFLFTPDHHTTKGVHVRDPMDMKRLMIMVIYALVPCILVGMYNVGFQGYLGEGVSDPSAVDSLMRGAWHMLPIIITSYTAGGIAELIFSVVRKHEINEGFLVTAMLYPLILPPSTPLWMVAMGIIFGVVIGKEVFGGVGMNILNPALVGRAFVFFTYPAAVSGAKVWDVVGTANPLTSTGAEVDGYTGATPLLAVSDVSRRGEDAVAILAEYNWTWWDLASGQIPGSMAEVSAIAIAMGAVLLIVTGIASWRIMAGCVAGLVAVSAMFNGFAGPESLPLMTLAPHYHLVMGGFAFGTVFMATDPVSSANTDTGRWIYGFCIGAMAVIIRVVNPAYPEGMMLAILFMNVFAPLIDHYVVQSTTSRRTKRMAAA